MSRIKRFVINGIMVSTTALIVNTISMSFNIYVSNRVGTEAIGVFSLVMSVYALAITISSSGVNLATMKIVSERLARDANCNLKRISKQCLKFSLFLGVLASVIFILLAKTISIKWLHNKVSPVTIYFIAVALPFISMSSSMNGYFCAVRKMYKSAFSQGLETIIKIVAILLLLNIFIDKGVEYICLALIIGDFISEVLSFIYLFFIYNLDLNKLPLYRNNSNCRKRFISICAPVAVTSYIKSGLSTLKQMLIPVKLEQSGASCSNALSQYGLVSGMAMPIFMFPSVFINAFSNLLVPEITSFYERKEFFKINKTISIIFTMAFAFAFCVFGVFCNFSSEIGLFIYNNNDVVFFLKLLCPLVLFIYLDNIIDCILKGLNKQVGIMLCNILDLFVSISFICILLPRKGIIGYVIVLFISEILNFSISLFQLKRTTNFSFDYMNWILKPAFSVLISTFIIRTLALVWNGTLSGLVFVIATFVAVYCLIYGIVSVVVKRAQWCSEPRVFPQTVPLQKLFVTKFTISLLGLLFVYLYQ